MTARSSPRRSLLAVLAALAGCEAVPVRIENAIDPKVYRTCADPEAAAAWQRAVQALQKGHDAAALPDLRVCVERCKNFLPAHLAYQDVARRLGGDAQRAMQALYVAGPDSGETVATFLRARLADTSYAQCNALDAILVKDPSFAWGHVARARVTRRQGRLLQALDMFAQATLYDPEMHDAHLERAQVLAELGRDEEAAVEYRAYLRGVPDDVPAQRAFVTLLLYRLGRIDEANGILAALEQRDPKELSLRMDRAAAQWLAGRPRDAVDGYLSVLADDPRAARAALNVGMLYYEVLPKTDVERNVFWPKARAAFRLFLQLSQQPADGHEQFEKILAVPYRLGVIDDKLGAVAPAPVTIDDLRWPAGA